MRETETNKQTHTQREKKHGDPTEKKKIQKKYKSTRRERERVRGGEKLLRQRKDEKREMGWMRRNGTTLVDAVDAR